MAAPTKFVTMPVFAVLLMGCAADRQFYSIHAGEFVSLDALPERTALVGQWRTAGGESLSLSSDGKFVAGRVSGCWDANEKEIEFHYGCVNSCNNGYSLLPVAEMSERCAFVGEYRRDNGTR